jgi:hypothetical protein
MEKISRRQAYRCIRALFVLAAVVLGGSLARADFIYTVSFSAVTYRQGTDGPLITIDADSFSFRVPSLLTHPIETPTVPVPGGELNGFHFESLTAAMDGHPHWGGGPVLYLSASDPEWASLPDGAIGGFFFGTDVWPEGVGTWESNGHASRAFRIDGGGDSVWGDGSLTITEIETAPAPEPATLLLLAPGLAILYAVRCRK